MANLTASQIYALARSAGFNAGEAVTATAIALAESGGNPAAVGDTGLQTSVWGPSIGLWQVRSLKAESGKGTTRDATKLTDPSFNAASAYKIYKGNNGWRNWSVYTSGKYRSNVTAVETSVGTQESSGGLRWWEKLLAVSPASITGYVLAGGVGVAEGNLTAEQAGQAITGTVAGGVFGADAGAAVSNANRVLETLNSPEFWKRFGIGALGVLVVLLAILVMVWAGKDKLLKGTVGSVVGAVTKGK